MADQDLKVVPEVKTGPPSARLGVVHAVVEWPDQGFRLLQGHAAVQGSESAAGGESDDEVKSLGHAKSEAAPFGVPAGPPHREGSGTVRSEWRQKREEPPAVQCNKWDQKQI
jgi:hypothetical protein